jgi:iron complex outermembrane receptor protein
MYYERDDRRVPLQSDFHQRIFDIDLQHHFVVDRHTITWGAGYRWNSDTTFPTPILQFVPASRTYPMQAAFIQDEISFSKDRVTLQVGSKFEHNDFSNLEAQPSARLSWTVHPDHFLWTAITRAVRTPTRFDSDIRFGPPTFQFVGNPDFKSEEETALEWGYRARPTPMMSVDIATYFNVYDRLRSLELQRTGQVSILNNLNAHTYGAEIAATYDVLDDFRISGGYSYFGKNLTLDAGHVDAFNGTVEGNDPKHQFLLRGSADLPHSLEWDGTLRFVDNLPAPPVPSYFELDQRVGWSPTRNLEFSVVGRNLLHDRHPEFGPASPTREEVRREVFGGIALRF